MIAKNYNNVILKYKKSMRIMQKHMFKLTICEKRIEKSKQKYWFLKFSLLFLNNQSRIPRNFLVLVQRPDESHVLIRDLKIKHVKVLLDAFMICRTRNSYNVVLLRSKNSNILAHFNEKYNWIEQKPEWTIGERFELESLNTCSLALE